MTGMYVWPRTQAGGRWHALKHCDCYGHHPQAGLTLLDLCECTAIRDFAALAQLRRLDSLSLEGCDVAAGVLLRICRSCPLTQLNLASSSEGRVNDATLGPLARALPLVQGLDLTNCAGVTDAGAMVLLDHCKELLLLGLSGCSVSRATADHAARVRPACEVDSGASRP